jgi:hypothetical protein
MTCPIDHSDPVAIPALMCRVCSPWPHAASDPVANGEPFARAVAPALEPEGYSTTKVRTVNLTAADLRAIAEITDTRVQSRTTKSNGRVARMLVKKASKEIPKDARWCSRTNQWVRDKNVTNDKTNIGG